MDSEILYKKKALGQYFTSPLLSDLLVELSETQSYFRVIDPMCGAGNILDSLLRHGADPNNLTGIEIDPQYSNKEHPYKVINSNAFNPDIYQQLSSSFDLVITNPPYVRYQEIKSNQLKEIQNYSIEEIRSNLKTIITSLNHLTSNEKKMLLNLSDRYSGLSNLAIPCWILCMALTSQQGTLSLVVPETWLSREYSSSLKKIMLRLFDIKFLVVDDNPSWFDDAYTKTNLIILKRKVLDSNQIQPYCKIELSRFASGKESILDNVSIDEFTGKDSIIPILQRITPKSCKNIRLEYLDQNSFTDSVHVLLKTLISPMADLTTLEKIGVDINQGLRSGANKFFHLKMVEHGKTDSIMMTNFDYSTIQVPNNYLVPLIKHVPKSLNGLTILSPDVSDYLLYIKQIENPGSDLYEYIRKVETTPVNVKGRDVLIPTLTAVKVNEKWTSKWYMLPELKPRHVPQLLMPRIIYEKPFCYMNYEKMVVDANFITINYNKSDEDCFAIFALLNSTWVWLCAEIYGTRFSGGALKFEAIQLKKIPIPVLTKSQMHLLSNIGHRLADGDSNAISDADALIFGALNEKQESLKSIEDAKSILESITLKRGRR